MSADHLPHAPGHPYGPLEKYLRIDGLDEIFFTRYDEGFYIAHGQRYQIEEPVFGSADELHTFLVGLAQANGQEIEPEQPRLDTVLADGSRLSATFDPLSDSPDFAIRPFLGPADKQLFFSFKAI